MNRRHIYRAMCDAGILLGNRPSFFPSFIFDPRNTGSIVPSRGGFATITTSRASTATAADFEGKIYTALANETRMVGQRRVYNVAPTDVSTWAVTSNTTVTGGVADPLGGTSAYTITATGATGFRAFATTNTVNGRWVNSIWVRRRTGTGVLNMYDGNGVNSIVATSIVTSAWQRITAGAVSTSTGSGNIGFAIATSGDAIDVWRPQGENITGQSNENPAEWVDGSATNGANVNGVRYFPWLNGNTVSSNVVTEATGALIPLTTNRGYLPEAAATQLVTPLASVRDMTNAAWVKTNCSSAFTSVGWDGSANSATRLTAAAANATILQTLVTAAATRTYSVGLKRVTGTGNIEITQDGATWTNISSQLNSSTFTRVSLAASQLNPQFGIRIVTSGDAVDADFNQYETGDVTGVYNSRIPDSITTRAADSLTYSTTGWLNASAGTLAATFLNPSTSATYSVVSLNDTTANNTVVIGAATLTSGTFSVTTGGAAQAALSAVSITSGASAKIAGGYQVNNFLAYANGTSLGTDVSGTIPTVTRLEILPFGNPVANTTYFPSLLPAATTQGIST